MQRLQRYGAWLGVSLSALAALLLSRPADVGAETCLSPFVKRLDRPEKYLYVFCVDAAARNNDCLIVIDVDIESQKYGKIIHQLDLGSSGNETHHFGYTDDRTHIWGCSLFSNRVFLIDVADNPAKPKLVKVIDSSKESGLTGPHSPYALPGRMLLSYLGGKDGGLPAGLAEFKNDGTFLRTLPLPKEAPYGYDVAIQPDLNRMVTSSFTPPENYKKPMAQMDFKKFGNTLLVWDYRGSKVLARLTTGAAPLECRWSLKGKNHGFTNCALDDSVWVWEGDTARDKDRDKNRGGKYTARKLFDTGKLPADLRQSPDDRFLYVSCFVGNEIQQWDVSDLKKPKLTSTIVPGVQPNMMHVTGDGKRMYITNSLLSTLDRSSNFWVRLAHIGPDGMKMDPFFNIDLTRCPVGKGEKRMLRTLRGHDMLLN
jgi:selenium-binding protein 1